MTHTRHRAAAFLAVLSFLAGVPGMAPTLAHHPLVHKPGFPPPDDDESREPAIVEVRDEDERAG